MRDALHPAMLALALASATAAHADWRDPIAGAMPIRAARFEPGDGTLTVHARPRVEPSAADGEAAMPQPRWHLPLVDRRLDAGERAAPLSTTLREAIDRIEPIYDPTRLNGPVDIVPMRVSAGTAETRDLFGDQWRLASADPNVDVEIRPLALAWAATAVPRPCGGFRVRRVHAWGEPALSAPTAADCRMIVARQARGFADTAPLPVAVAPPPLPVFAAPEPGSRMSSEAFWAARAAQIAEIRAHLQRKWASRRRGALRAAMK